MSIKRIVLKVVVSLACLAPAAGMDVRHPQGPYTEPVTGMMYPEAVGAFRRINVIKYALDGSDESVGYNLLTPGSEISTTVYFFASPALRSLGSPQAVIDDARAEMCQRQFQGIEQEILRAHPAARLLTEENVSLDQMGSRFAGHKAVYEMNFANFFGRRQTIRSEAYLFCYAGSRWSVEYRIDYPIGYDASAQIAAFMRDFEWTMTSK